MARTTSRERRGAVDVSPTRRSIPIGDGELTVATWGSGAPEIVLLHDGLGSISQWRDLPAGLHEAPCPARS